MSNQQTLKSKIKKLLGLSKTHAKVAFLGLDNSGKTTLLRILQDTPISEYESRYHRPSTWETFQIGNLEFREKNHSSHGHSFFNEKMSWKEYFQELDAIIYIIDSTDRSRFQQSLHLFEDIINADNLGPIPILILGNKIDRISAVSLEEIRNSFGLAEQTDNGVETVSYVKDKRVKLLMCSVVKKMGFMEGFLWLENILSY